MSLYRNAENLRRSDHIELVDNQLEVLRLALANERHDSLREQILARIDRALDRRQAAEIWQALDGGDEEECECTYE